MENKAVYLMENRKMEVRDTKMPELKKGDVKVKIHYCGVCGSDVHFYQQGEPAFPDIYPFILGHECAGEVVETGEGVTDLKPGDKVALEPGIACGKCEWCKSGKYNLCPSVRFLSAPVYDGAFRKYLTHPADLCFKLPQQVSTLEGALIEPLAVGLNAVKESGIRTGDKAVVLGAGCIGLVTLLSLKAVGITDITVVDLFELRLETAMELGATRVIHAKNTDVVEEYMKLTGGRGADYVYETAGSAVTTWQTVYLAKRGGVIMMIGNVVGETKFNFQLLVDKEVTIMSNFRYRNIYPVAIEAIASGRLPIKEIISTIYSFEDTQKAFEDCIENKQSMVKAVVKVGDDV